MSDNLNTELEPCTSASCHAQVEQARRDERGMITIEYAVGALMVIALIGVIIAAINAGVMQPVVKDFITFVLAQIKTLAKQ